MPANAVTVTATYKDNVNTGIGEISTANSLKAWTSNGLLHVEGLTVGKPFSIYSAGGAQIYQSIATSETADIAVSAQGVYIVQSEERTVKVVISD